MLRNVNIYSIVTVTLNLLFGAAANLPQPGVCGSGLADQMHEDSTTGLTSYPWTAILIYRTAGSTLDHFYCGGSLISDRFVLTAARCNHSINGVFVLDRIRLGEWDVLTDPDCIGHMDEEKKCNDPVVDVGVEKIIAHEEYDFTTLENDIALIKLNQSVTFTESIRPVCLPKTNRNKNINDMEFITIGWGDTEYGIGSRKYKLQVSLKGVKQRNCKKAFSKYGIEIFPSQLCAAADNGTNVCYGSVKNGLVSTVEGYYYIFGIDSYGYDCLSKRAPGVYTRVTSFVDWIKNNMD